MLLAVSILFLVMIIQGAYIATYGIVPGECSYNPQVDTLGFTLADECHFFAGYVCGTNDVFSSFKPDCASTESIFIYASGDCSGPVEHVVWGSLNQLYITDDNNTVPISCVYTK